MKKIDIFEENVIHFEETISKKYFKENFVHFELKLFVQYEQTSFELFEQTVLFIFQPKYFISVG